MVCLQPWQHSDIAKIEVCRLARLNDKAKRGEIAIYPCHLSSYCPKGLIGLLASYYSYLFELPLYRSCVVAKLLHDSWKVSRINLESPSMYQSYNTAQLCCFALDVVRSLNVL